MDTESEDKPVFARFEHYDELLEIQDYLLSLDFTTEPTEEENRNEHLRLWRFITRV